MIEPLIHATVIGGLAAVFLCAESGDIPSPTAPGFLCDADASNAVHWASPTTESLPWLVRAPVPGASAPDPVPPPNSSHPVPDAYQCSTDAGGQTCSTGNGGSGNACSSGSGGGSRQCSAYGGPWPGSGGGGTCSASPNGGGQGIEVCSSGINPDEGPCSALWGSATSAAYCSATGAARCSALRPPSATSENFCTAFIGGEGLFCSVQEGKGGECTAAVSHEDAICSVYGHTTGAGAICSSWTDAGVQVDNGEEQPLCKG